MSLGWCGKIEIRIGSIEVGVRKLASLVPHLELVFAARLPDSGVWFFIASFRVQWSLGSRPEARKRLLAVALADL